MARKKKASGKSLGEKPDLSGYKRVSCEFITAKKLDDEKLEGFGGTLIDYGEKVFKTEEGEDDPKRTLIFETKEGDRFEYLIDAGLKEEFIGVDLTPGESFYVEYHGKVSIGRNRRMNDYSLYIGN